MAEKPLDRLNYYNGQRLEAPDLKLEQDYHIRVRRLLNKSLYTPGIARGLEVSVQPGGPPTVIVGPGLALDAEGREIVLLEETPFPIDDATGSATEGQVQGNYLVIEYAEESVSRQQDGCAVKPAAAGKSGNRHAWGGPAVIRGQARLSMSDVLPFENSGQVVLGQIELDANCSAVRTVHAGVRRYAGGASNVAVRQYALEGSRDIDVNNPARIYFHVRGRQPNSVTLYLRGEQFPTFQYTELGSHDHWFDLQMSGGAHRHYLGITDPIVTRGCVSIEDLTDIDTKSHWQAKIDAAKEPVTVDELITWNLVVAPQYAQHWHNPDGEIIDTPGRGPRSVQADVMTHQDQTPEHTHSVTAKHVSTTGVSLAGRQNGERVAYVNDLQVYIDGSDDAHNQTKNIVAQISAMSTWGWPDDKLGDGTETHAFVKRDGELQRGGTGPIKLDFLAGLNLTEGEHWIELRVASIGGKPNGGRVLYNLYIE